MGRTVDLELFPLDFEEFIVFKGADYDLSSAKTFKEDTGVANLLKYGFFLDKVEGELFENSVYCFLRSLLGREFIRHWRTKQKEFAL